MGGHLFCVKCAFSMKKVLPNDSEASIIYQVVRRHAYRGRCQAFQNNKVWKKCWHLLLYLLLYKSCFKRITWKDVCCGCGGTGRRAGFRFQCLRACRFDSCHPYYRFTDRHADLAQLAEHFTSNEGVAGSNPVVGIWCEYSSVGRTLPCHGRGRGFESRCSLLILYRIKLIK